MLAGIVLAETVTCLFPPCKQGCRVSRPCHALLKNYQPGVFFLNSYNQGSQYIWNVFVGALAYADDVVLLAPTHSAMRRMLRVCKSVFR